MDITLYFYYIFIFVLGLLFGSFANVCIYRIPRDESICFPRSHCPGCSTMIRWYDNIPLLSYVLLRGKCRYCKTSISFEYPLVELVTAVLFTLTAWKFFMQPFLPVYLYFTFSLIVISWIDFYHQIIPDFFSYSLIVVGFAFSPFNERLGFTWGERMFASALGVLVCGGGLLLIGIAAEKIFKKPAMGGGDVKLMAGFGALLGITKSLLALFIASALGSVVGLGLIAFRRIARRDYIPFGPFLAAGAYISIFLPDTLDWLFGWIEGVLR